jgi:hypothetical protein
MVTTPTAAFITFRSDDSAIAALKFDGSNEGETLLGSPLKFVAASEPTDIIWENRRFTPMQYLRREISAYVLLGILLAGSVAIVYKISMMSADIASVFPTVDC